MISYSILDSRIQPGLAELGRPRSQIVGASSVIQLGLTAFNSMASRIWEFIWVPTSKSSRPISSIDFDYFHHPRQKIKNKIQASIALKWPFSSSQSQPPPFFLPYPVRAPGLRSVPITDTRIKFVAYTLIESIGTYI